MDSTTFDKLSVALSRRGVMRTIAAVFAGGAALAAADESHAAIRGCRTMRISCSRDHQCCSGYCERRSSVPRRQRFRCGCGIDQALCDGVCTQLGTEENCSTCGDACTGYDTCISGACIDACTVLTCDVDEECYQGACRKICVSGACVTGEICVAGVDLCLPNRCMDDPSAPLSGRCLSFSDGSFVVAPASNASTSAICTSNEECEIYFGDSTWGDAFVDYTYGVGCAAEVVRWSGSERYVDPTYANRCVEYVFVP